MATRAYIAHTGGDGQGPAIGTGEIQGLTCNLINSRQDRPGSRCYLAAVECHGHGRSRHDASVETPAVDYLVNEGLRYFEVRDIPCQASLNIVTQIEIGVTAHWRLDCGCGSNIDGMSPGIGSCRVQPVRDVPLKRELKRTVI